MYKRIDQSRALARFIQNTSSTLARQRGLLPLIGLSIIIVGFIFQIADVFTQSQVVELFGVLGLNIGIIVVILGLLLAEPLGK